MDPTEDLSARVLLKHILSTEPPRTPITRSVSKSLNVSRTRVTRSNSKGAGARTPKDILRRSLKQKIHESVSRKSLTTKRRSPSAVLRKATTPAVASNSFTDGDTPRHILMNILQTEPVKSPVVHEKTALEEQPAPSANSSIDNQSLSIELSGLDLPDITLGNVVSTIKGLSRKRPRRSLNVTAFEKRLKDAEDDESAADHSSLSLSSSTSLTLKTPFVDVHTEKRGLRRKVYDRRKVTEEEFGAAVEKREMGVSSFVSPLNESMQSAGLTLGFSKLSDLEVTNDIINSNTALYAQADAMTTSFFTAATQDKPTVMASQLQREMEQVEADQVKEESVEEELGETGQMEQSHPGKEKSMYVFPTERLEPESEGGISQRGEGAEVPSKDGEGDVAASKCENEDDLGESQPDGEETGAECQTEEKGAADPQTEEGPGSPCEEEEEEEDEEEDEEDEEEETADPQTEEGPGSPCEEEGEEDEEEETADPQTEEGPGSPCEEEEEEDEEEETADPQTEEETTAGPQTGGSSQSETDAYVTDTHDEDENDERREEEDGEQELQDLDHDNEHISQRAHRSEGGHIPAIAAAAENVPDAGWSSAGDFHHSLVANVPERSTSHHELPGSAADLSPQGPDDDKENAPHPLDPIDHLPEEEEEWEEDDEDIPMSTPAFVRERINFVVDPLTSPTVLKNPPASKTPDGPAADKPKPVRRKKTAGTKMEAGLPKNYLMGVFKHFAKTKVSADVYPVLKEIMDKFLERLADDLETFASHAKRKTIEVEDAVLLLRRQGHVNDKMPVEALIEKYLRMEQRRLLIPMATNETFVNPKLKK